MIYHALTLLEWDAEQFWRAPANCSLGLDTRGLSDQALRGEYGDWPWAYVLSETQQTGDNWIDLGSGRVDEIRIADQKTKDAWLSCFGSPFEGDTLLDGLWNLGTVNAVVDGSVPMKPLMPERSGDVCLYLPFHSPVRRVPFGVWNPSGNRYHNRVRDLLKLDLDKHDKECKSEAMRLKDEAKELRKQNKIREAEEKEKRAASIEPHAESVMDAICRKYKCDPKELSATVKSGKAKTTISDEFSSSLTGWTVVGTGNWGTVDAGGGDYHLKRTSGSYSRNHVYHNTALSSADHYTQAAYYAGTYTGHEHQVMVRAATGAFTGYAFGNTETSGSRWNSVINKIVSGTETSLQNELDFTLGWSNGGLLKGNVSGTTLTNTYRGDAHASVTDSAISTGLNIGCTSYGVDDRTFGSIYATDGIPDGWTHKIHGIAAGGMAKIHGVPKANVAKVMGT